MTKWKRPPSLLLLLGAALIALAYMRWGLAPMAWMVPIPFLLYLEDTSGKRQLLFVLLAPCVGFTLATLKIITHPLPWYMALLFGIPIGFFHGLPLLLFALTRRWVPRRGVIHWEIFLFASLATLSEWVQYTFTPLGTWGSQADTQIGHLPLLQMISLTGISGLSFLMYWFGALAAGWFTNKRKSLKIHSAVAGLLFVGILVYGQLRIEYGTRRNTRTIAVATIATDSTVGTSKALPSDPYRQGNLDALLRRTRRAARMGAQVIVWTEAATLVLTEEEEVFLSKVSATARESAVHLVAAYVLLLERDPVKYRNAYVWIRPDGTIDHTYLKHRPVPGEPVVRGTGPSPMVVGSMGRMSGAICYDFNFPAEGRERAGAELVLLPSSDWRGIDPIHTQMAALRAIENGYSLVRSTRFGFSAAYDVYGRLLGGRSSFESHEPILLTWVPLSQVTTLYALLGDWFPALLVLFLSGLLMGRLAVVGSNAIKARHHRKREHPKDRSRTTLHRERMH